nr:hypothetical protein [Pantoea cypripedii]
MITITRASNDTVSQIEHPLASENTDNHRSIMIKLLAQETNPDEFQLKDIHEDLPFLLNKELHEVTESLQNYMDGKVPPLTSLTFSRFDEKNNLIAVTTISAEEGDTANLKFHHSKLDFFGGSEDIRGSLNNCSEIPCDLFLSGDKLVDTLANDLHKNTEDGYGGDVLSPSLTRFISTLKDSSVRLNEKDLFKKLFSTSEKKFKELNNWVKYAYLNSETARKLIDHAAQDNTKWKVTNASKEFKSDLTNKILYIPENYNFKNSRYAAVRHYLHELVHRCTGLPDRDGDHKSGPIVQLVNKIMNEFGTKDVRLEYENIKQCSPSGMVGMYKVNKERIRTIEQIKSQAIYWHGNLDSPEARYFINMAMAESRREMEKNNREGEFNHALEALSMYKERQENIRRTERENYYQEQESGKAALKSREREERDTAMEQRGNFNILTDIITPLSNYVDAVLNNLNTLTANEISTNIYSLTRLGDLLRSNDEICLADIEKQRSLIHEVRKDLKKLEGKGNLSSGLKNTLDAIKELDAELKKINENKSRIAEIDKQIAEGDAHSSLQVNDAHSNLQVNREPDLNFPLPSTSAQVQKKRPRPGLKLKIPEVVKKADIEAKLNVQPIQKEQIPEIINSIKNLPVRFAVTGSAALEAHASNQGVEFYRKINDLDLMTDNLTQFTHFLSKNTDFDVSHVNPAEGNGWIIHKPTNQIIDVLEANHSSYGAIGNIDEIGGIPVRSLSNLKESLAVQGTKQDDLSFANKLK